MSVSLTLNGVAFASPSTPGFTPGMRVVVTVALTVSPDTIALIDAQKGGELVANIAPTSVTYRTTAGVLLGTGPTTAVPVKFHALQRSRPTLGRLVSLNMASTFYTGSAYCTTFRVVGASIADAGDSVGGGSIPPDPHWAQVQLLLRGYGANGSTTITDSSSFNRAPQPGYPHSISNAVQLFGNNTIRFPAGFRLSYASAPWFNLNDGDWTIEVWAYELAGGGGSLMCRRPGGTGSGWAWTRAGLRARINGVWSDTQMAWTSPPINEWHLYTLVRAGTTLYAFVDGALVATRTSVTTIEDVGSEPLTLGQSDSSSENRFNGYMAQVRWTKGTARYTAPFAPPGAPWVDDTGGVFVPPTSPDVGGLLGRYYNNLDLVGLPVWSGKEVPLVQFSRFSTTEWRPGLGVPNVTGGGMSARWTGFVRVPTSGKWQFQCNMDDGGKFFFQGQTVFDRWEAGVGQVNSGWLDLEAGVNYPVWLEYLNYVADAYYDFRWQTQVAGTPTGMVQVPGSALYASLPTEPTRTIVLNSGHFVTPVNRY